jgi:hypothetical protein
MLVDRLGDALLASAALPLDEDIRVRASDASDLRTKLA